MLVDGNGSSGFNPPRGKLPAPTCSIGEEKCIFRWRRARIAGSDTVCASHKCYVIIALGWVVVDDTDNFVLGANDWWVGQVRGLHDLYFFGHGRNYKKALSDFT